MIDLKEILGRAILLIESRSGDVDTEDGSFATTGTDQIIHLEQALADAFNPTGDDAIMEECWDQVEVYCHEITLLKERVKSDPLNGKYKDTLKPFVENMDIELHANSGKGDREGWLQMSPDTALLEIFYHLGKLQKACKKGDLDGVKEYSADVANMSMMLADVFGIFETSNGA